MFEADRGSSQHRWPVVRMGQGSRTRVTLLSTAFFSLTTHWWQHTVPCSGDGCRLCEVLPGRGLFYVAVMVESRVSILELGAQSASHLEQHLKLMHGGMLAGHVIELVRVGKKSPIRGECVETLPGVGGVTLRELVAHVLALYKLPGPNPSETLEVYETRIAALTRARNERVIAEVLRKGTVVA